jgi:DnaJ-class molecular chaperone
VPIDTLVLGGSVPVDYLGEQIELEIPEMCQPGFVLSRRGAGLKLGAATGDLYVRVEAAFPRDAESRETLKKRFQSP